ncbi:Hypothetical predicted protein [Scomber scombrus]|uniref:Uncharacterized protein n=1 Tax=Scomber scombrus TaxID=13677 RepID=A0AAV1P9W2_SCOSC
MASGQEHHVPCCPRPSLISLCLDSSLASVSAPKGKKRLVRVEPAQADTTSGPHKQEDIRGHFTRITLGVTTNCLNLGTTQQQVDDEVQKQWGGEPSQWGAWGSTG